MKSELLYGLSAVAFNIHQYDETIESMNLKEYCEKPAHVQTLEKTLEGRRDAQRDIYDAKVERMRRLEERTPAQKRAIAKRRQKAKKS